MFAGTFRHPDDLMRSWQHAIAAQWDPHEQYQAPKKKAAHINQLDPERFEPFDSEHKGLVAGDTATRYLPNGIVIEQKRTFKKQLLHVGQYRDWMKKEDVQRKMGTLVKYYQLGIGVMYGGDEILYGDDIPPYYQRMIREALSEIPDLLCSDQRGFKFHTEKVTPANAFMRELAELEAHSMQIQDSPIRDMNDNFHRVPPVIERDTFKRLFTPLFDANGNVTGMSRPYFFEHNSFGLDVHAEFPEPLLYQKYSSAIRKRSTKDSVALVARWNLRPFTFGEGTYDDWGFHTPAITTAESMPDRTFNYLDKVFAEVTGGAVRVPYAFTAPKELKQVNDLLSRIKAMKPHDDVVDQNMMRWSQSRAFQDVTLTDDWNDGFIEPANRQGWLFSGKATRPSSAKHGMPPERRSYG